ncbi:MAG: nucleoid occlusion protein [Evtepia sp.]|nr:nucleoid occlusion protein [Evtepia sp.]
MALLQRRSMLDSNRVILIQPDLISPNPDQPRQYFDPQGLAELADSIRIHGILQPLTVRRRSGGRFELVAGERRLRAAVICGLSEVPCLIMDITRESSCVLSLIENLQRRDLDFFEEAQALDRLISLYGLSQEEAAIKVGKSQSAVANKLRLLRLPSEVLETLRKNGYTERHARALLRLPNAESQLTATSLIVEEGFNVARTEQYVSDYLDALSAPPALPEPDQKKDKPCKRTSYLIRDIRFFLNSVNHGLSLMKSSGVNAECTQVEEGDSILLTIRIPKQHSIH